MPYQKAAKATPQMTTIDRIASPIPNHTRSARDSVARVAAAGRGDDAACVVVSAVAAVGSAPVGESVTCCGAELNCGLLFACVVVTAAAVAAAAAASAGRFRDVSGLTLIVICVCSGS